MSDLIDRQAAIGAVNTALFPKINTAKDAEKALRALPSAQPEIIRCRDCVWNVENVCRNDDCPCRDDDFCSWAERREE